MLTCKNGNKTLLAFVYFFCNPSPHRIQNSVFQLLFPVQHLRFHKGIFVLVNNDSFVFLHCFYLFCFLYPFSFLLWNFLDILGRCEVSRLLVLLVWNEGGPGVFP